MKNIKPKLKLLRNVFLSYLKVKGITTTILILTCLSLFAQQNWKFGSNHSLIVGHASAPLTVTMHSTSLKSYGFLGKVGGVSFSAIAKPDASLTDASLSISYSALNPDGKRLLVIINNDTLYPQIYDWQLIPISKYANSTYTACVSLFGENNSEYAYDITYHEAFQNTLLGARLLQADILLMDIVELSQIPKYNDSIILGKGEKAPPINNINLSAVYKIDSILNIDDFQSWVFTDNNVNVTFRITDGKFSISGFPYYYFWSTDENGYLKTRDSLVALAYIAQSNNNSVTYNSLANKIDQLEPAVIYNKEVTEEMKRTYSKLRSLNPLVFDAAERTMRYAAFFRFIKKINYDSWSDYFNQVRSVRIKPVVNTPTAWEK